MTHTSAAVRPASLNEPIQGKVLAVMGNRFTQCVWHVQQLSLGDDVITFCHHSDEVSTADTPWLQNLTVGSEVTSKRTARSTSRPGESIGLLLVLAPQDSPEQTTSGRWITRRSQQPHLFITDKSSSNQSWCCRLCRCGVSRLPGDPLAPRESLPDLEIQALIESTHQSPPYRKVMRMV